MNQKTPTLPADVLAVLTEMRERKINHGKDTSPTLIAWADRIEKALGETIQLALKLEGGLVHWIGTNSPLPHEILIIDYDTEGADADEIYEIPQDSGGTATAIAMDYHVDYDPTFVERAYLAVRDAHNTIKH